MFSRSKFVRFSIEKGNDHVSENDSGMELGKV
jgi:hypothetical protein